MASGCLSRPRLRIAVMEPRIVEFRYVAGDVEYLESRQFTAAEIARFYAVPRFAEIVSVTNCMSYPVTLTA